jgi:WD40 repeat protein
MESSSTSTTPPTPPPHISLGLEEDDDVLPRRFLRLGSRHLLAYGGDNGNVTCLSNKEFVIVQRYDDGVRALAVSKDGRRLAIGFETGETKVYAFDDYNDMNDDDTTTKFHPFVRQAMERKAKPTKDDEDDVLLLMSQDVDDDALEDNSFLGPEFSSPIRDLLFLDNTAEDDDYQLAIASEEGMCIVNATNFEKLSESAHVLEREAKEHHDNGGIRGFALQGNVLASLAMDGRLCLWDAKEHKLLLREKLTCITKKDVGEVHDADAYDRSCRPLFVPINDGNKVAVGTPGNLTPFLRRWDGDKKEDHEFDPSAFDEAGIGHIETIVAMAVTPEGFVVTSGRDNRLVLWKCQNNDSSTALEKKWKAVQRFELESPATDLCLMDNQLYAACSKGNCYMLDLDKYLVDKKSTGTPTSSVLKSKKKDALDDDDDDVDFASSEGPKTSYGVRFVDEEADEDNDEKEPKADPETQTNDEDVFHTAIDENMDSNFGMEDIANTHQQLMPSTFGRMQRKVEPQEAFSPSETFPDNDDELRRFLCWNHIGSATILEGNDDVNTVDIHFTDSAFKKSISFTDGVGLILGSIGEEGGIFASGLQNIDDEEDAGNDMDDFGGWKMSEQTKAALRRDQKKNKKGGEESEPKGSQVLFYKYESLENKRFPIWSINLPDGEEVVGVSCGIGWSAVMTR